VPHKDPEARRAYQRAYKAVWLVKNADRLREQQREWRKRNPEKAAEYNRAWYQRNRERLLAHEAELERQRRATNGEAVRERERRYRAEHSPRYVERNRRRRDAMGGYTVLDRDKRRMLSRYRGRCAYCAVRPFEHWDHVIPIIRGGRHTIGNLLPACKPCNLRKGTRLLIEAHEIRGGDSPTGGRKEQPLSRPAIASEAFDRVLRVRGERTVDIQLDRVHGEESGDVMMSADRNVERLRDCAGAPAHDELVERQVA
jgi:5-methylcytosine-specific restriction endonuclease McrA